MLVNRYVRFGECWIGGWYPPEIVREPDMLDGFEAQEGVKVLLCHKPEHYIQYMRGRALDLVVAGHAHGRADPHRRAGPVFAGTGHFAALHPRRGGRTDGHLRGRGQPGAPAALGQSLRGAAGDAGVKEDGKNGTVPGNSL